MKSRWYELKPKAIKLRKKGASLKDVEDKLSIPRSTLSGWFRNIKLNSVQKKSLETRWRNALVKARKRAVIWHNKGKIQRLAKAEDEADKIIQRLNFNNRDLLDVGLAFLYLGEGSKGSATSMGNSDPAILKFFLGVLIKNYQIKRENIKCYLHLRADQNPTKMKKFWSKELDIPIKNFGRVSIDLRTKGKTTYESYKGVCVIEAGNVAIQRKMLYLSKKFIQKTINKGD